MSFALGVLVGVFIGVLMVLFLDAWAYSASQQQDQKPGQTDDPE